LFWEEKLDYLLGFKTKSEEIQDGLHEYDFFPYMTVLYTYIDIVLRIENNIKEKHRKRTFELGLFKFLARKNTRSRSLEFLVV
jgi:hypothetical protein